MEMVQRYLSPSKAKLAAKGVDSVRSRVVNLKEFVPDLTIERLSDALIAALAEVYAVGGGVLDAPNLSMTGTHGLSRTPAPTQIHPLRTLSPDEFDLQDLTAKYASDAWLYGPKLPFTLSVEDRFPWGGIELQLDVNEGVIRTAKVYTDAMDETLAPKLEAALTDASLSLSALETALREIPNNGDLLALLRGCI